jgi:heat shock protein HslJ
VANRGASAGREHGVRVWKFASILCVSVLGQAACQVKSVHVGSPSVAVSVVGTEWRLVELEGRPVTASAAPSLLLTEDTKASGFAGCNRYTGTYDLADERLTFGRLATTRMFCAETMDVEEQFLTALDKTRGFRQTDADLVLISEGGPVARFQKR